MINVKLFQKIFKKEHQNFRLLLTPRSGAFYSVIWLCDNERERIAQPNYAVKGPMERIVMPI